MKPRDADERTHHGDFDRSPRGATPCLERDRISRESNPRRTRRESNPRSSATERATFDHRTCTQIMMIEQLEYFESDYTPLDRRTRSRVRSPFPNPQTKKAA